MLTTLSETAGPALDQDQVMAAAWRAARLIPPLWPLAATVAVNPFLGQTGETLAQASARLGRSAGLAATMPRDWYKGKLDAGEVSRDDLLAALLAAPDAEGVTLDELEAAAARPRPAPVALPTVASCVAEASGIDWPGLLAERISQWAAGYFDEGQALWTAARPASAYAAWRTVATHDLTPEIAGLRGFAARVASLPQTAEQAILQAADALGLSGAALDSLFHSLLTELGGWSQVARYRLWQAELAGGEETTLIDLLAIRLVWDQALQAQYASAIAPAWRQAIVAHSAPLVASRDDVIDALLQEATERSGQRQLATALARNMVRPQPARPALQMAFCIDVRSEVFRRSLESLDPDIETLGFAGFFGLCVTHRRFASERQELRLPVLLNPALSSRSGGHGRATEMRAQAVQTTARARRAWGRFKLAAISSFAFVEATGPVYMGKLLRDALGFARGAPEADPAPELDPALDLDTRIAMAAGVLNAMSLTQSFAPIVILAGHGANVVNNPHASALQCGACGGYSGEVNARLLAALLNTSEVRDGLAERGLPIPPDTLFLAALHDTTTDEITLYDTDQPTDTHAADITRVRRWLAAAGALARGERAVRLPRATTAGDIARRAVNWAEIRPEWGLAGCQAFIAAPRRRSAGRDLGGRAFLHDYDWRKDAGFGVLELILTAPVVVASWISLQYYGSVVAPALFGAGNKLLHNVTGGIGVVEGNGGLLRGGLPWQSVHDGVGLAHEPLRLTVLVEAPCEAISTILAKHTDVRALFDSRWLHLMALDEAGEMAWRYAGNLEWEDIRSPAAAAA